MMLTHLVYTVLEREEVKLELVKGLAALPSNPMFEKFYKFDLSADCYSEGNEFTSGDSRDPAQNRAGRWVSHGLICAFCRSAGLHSNVDYAA